MTEEVKVGARPVSFLIGAIYALIMVLIVAFMYGSTGLGAHFVGIGNKHIDFLVLWAPLIFISFITMALPRRLRLSERDLTVIYSMATIGSIMPTLYGVLPSFTTEAGFGSTFSAYLPLTVAITNPLFVPKDINVIKAMIYGGPVPWSAWTLPIIWWSTFLLVQNLLFITLAALLRRLYIDLENLPFPTTTGEASIIEAATNPEARSRTGKWLLLGFILGIVTTASIWIEPVFPGLGITSQNLYIDLTPLALLPWVPLYLSFDTFYIAVGYFIPTEILLSTIIFYIILFMIIPLIATAAGIFGPFPAGITQPGYPSPWGAHPYGRLFYGFPESGAGWINWGSSSWGYASVILGCLFAATLYEMFRLRGQIKASIRGFIASFRSGGSEDGDVSTRLLGISFIVLYVIYSVMLSYGTYWYVPVWVSLLFTGLLLFIFCMAYGFARGYYCDGFGGVYQGFPHIVAYSTMIGQALGLGVPLKPPQITDNARISYSFSRLFRSFGATHRWATGTVGPRTLELFRLGTLTKTRDRDIIVAVTIGTILTIIVTIPLWIWLSYTYGIGKSWNNAHGFATNLALTWIYLRQFVTPYMTGPMPWTVWLWYLLGAIIAVLLFKMRERYPRFPLHPMGLVGVTLGPVMFMPWIIALILKQITFKIGGYELYRDKGVPIASGLLGGWATMLVISHILLTLRQIGVIA